MITTALATLLATAAAVPAGTFAGSTPLAPEVTMTVQSGRVVSASAWTQSFSCELGGNVGPASVSVRPNAPISSNGSVRFSAGRKTRRLHARLRYSRGKLTGRIQLTGTIGGACSSPSIAVTLRRR